MDALHLLLNRSSQPRLSAPAPSDQVLENIMQAALRAPDHACLTPWQFIVCQGKGLDKLGALYEQSAIENGKSQQEIDRAVKLPHRAPMVVVAVAKYVEHEKVPRVEQIASASCGVMAMQMAAVAQGFNGSCPDVMQGIERMFTYAMFECLSNHRFVFVDFVTPRFIITTLIFFITTNLRGKILLFKVAITQWQHVVSFNSIFPRIMFPTCLHICMPHTLNTIMLLLKWCHFIIIQYCIGY